MFKAIAEKLFQRHPQEDELVKLRQIAERAKRFEEAVIESMQVSYDDSEQQRPESHHHS
jgi:hypothetical protein